MALNTLEESEQVYSRLAGQARERNHPWMEDRFTRKAQTIRERAAVIRRLLTAEPQEGPMEEDQGAQSAEDDRADVG